MSRLARLSAVLWAGLWPALSIAQQGGAATGPRTPYAWLWIVAAVLVVAALSVLIFRGGGLRPPTPPVRKP